jgi:hypothetical protein
MGTTFILTPVATPVSDSTIRHLDRLTAWDAVEDLLDTLGGNPAVSPHRSIKRGILAAYREFPSLFDWQFLFAIGRLNLYGVQNTGTIAFDLTGGAFERLVTISDATWPTWAERGYLQIGEVTYEVDRRIDATRLVLREGNSPPADVAAGSAYSLGLDSYPLPVDFMAGDAPEREGTWGGMSFVLPRDWQSEVRHDMSNSGSPTRYTYTGDPKGTGGLVMRVRPVPDRDQTIDFVYRRKMRPLRVWDESTGYATVVNGSATLTLTGGGVFQEWMEGSIVRLGPNATTKPEGRDSPNAYSLERTVRTITSSTTAQLDEPADISLSGVGYRISDPIDLESDAAYNALIAGARRHMTVGRNRPDERKEIEGHWQLSLNLAKEADQRDISRRSASVGGGGGWSLANGRVGPDIE